MTDDRIFQILISFDKRYDRMSDNERRKMMELLIAQIAVYNERQSNGQWLKSICFKLPIIEQEMQISLDNEKQVSTVALLKKEKPIIQRSFSERTADAVNT